jgi:hypothetical protein
MIFNPLNPFSLWPRPRSGSSGNSSAECFDRAGYWRDRLRAEQHEFDLELRRAKRKARRSVPVWRLTADVLRAAYVRASALAGDTDAGQTAKPPWWKFWVKSG